MQASGCTGFSKRLGNGIKLRDNKIKDKFNKLKAEHLKVLTAAH